MRSISAKFCLQAFIHYSVENGKIASKPMVFLDMELFSIGFIEVLLVCIYRESLCLPSTPPMTNGPVRTSCIEFRVRRKDFKSQEKIFYTIRERELKLLYEEALPELYAVEIIITDCKVRIISVNECAGGCNFQLIIID